MAPDNLIATVVRIALVMLLITGVAMMIVMGYKAGDNFQNTIEFNQPDLVYSGLKTWAKTGRVG